MKKNLSLSRLGESSRKIVLSAIIMMSVVGNIWSQETAISTIQETSKVRLGAKAGINISNVKITNSGDDYGMGSTVGVVGGLTLEYNFNTRWFFHSGIEYSMKGFEYDEGTSLKSTAVFINVPAAVGYKLNIGKGWNFEPRLGLYLAYGVAGKTSAKDSKNSASVNTFGDKILNPMDAGTLFGLFFDNNRFVIGLQGENGLTEANGDKFKVTGAKAHNTCTTICVGLLF